MSSKKKKTVMPMSSAGLISFYNTDQPGIKVTPTAILALTISFIVISIVLLILKPV
ncbi:MAG: preprotein translocase subunit Sec61beta [Nitrososphaeria archaeon]|jgi:preprotein translocase subunit Sec61beta|nr:preprotein translocase subunit Sec61beta [Nitrososphaerota archaeon]